MPASWQTSTKRATSHSSLSSYCAIGVQWRNGQTVRAFQRGWTEQGPKHALFRHSRGNFYYTTLKIGQDHICMYSIFGREIAKYTVIHSAYTVLANLIISYQSMCSHPL